MEKTHLNGWIINKLKDHRLWFGDGESNGDDPRSQTEDLSDNAIKAGAYGIKNLQRIVPQLMQWTKVENADYENLGQIYNQVSGQFARYMGHVTRNVGGIYKTPRVIEDADPVFEYEPKAKQAESVAFLNQQLFNTPTWLINNDIFARTGGNPLTIIGNIQDGMLNRLFGANTLNKLVMAETNIGNNAYKITDLFSDLQKGIWAELATKKPIDVYRRNLQKSYVNILGTLLNPPSMNIVLGGGAPVNTDKSDISSVVRAHLVSLRAQINAATAGITDQMSKYHLQDISKRIDKALDPKN